MGLSITAIFYHDPYYFLELPCKHFEDKVFTGCAFLDGEDPEVAGYSLVFFKPVGHHGNSVIVKAPYLADIQHVRIDIRHKNKQKTVCKIIERSKVQKPNGDEASYNRLAAVANNANRLEALRCHVEASRYCPLGTTLAIHPKDSSSQPQERELRFFNADGTALKSKRHQVRTILGDTITTPLHLWDVEFSSTPNLIIAEPSEDCSTGTTIRNARGFTDNLFADRTNAYDVPYCYVDKDASRPTHAPSFEKEPLFSIIVPLFNTPTSFFNEMVDSVMNQSFTNFELILVNASTNNKELSSLAASAVESDNRIKLVQLQENLGITENTNAGIDIAQGEFLCFLDHDDILDTDALGSYARAIDINPSIDLFYCDEDMLENGQLRNPLFKPDFNLDLLRSKNYIIHFLAIRTELFKTMPRPSREFDGAQDYNATLFAAEHARVICHVQKPLYHWRVHSESTSVNPDAKPYAENAGCLALQKHLDRTVEGAIARSTEIKNIYTVDYPMPSKNDVSVITVAGAENLNADWMQGYEVLRAPDYSFLSLNKAAAEAHGCYLLFLDAADVVCTPTIIPSLISLCARQDVGAVGMKVVDGAGVVEASGYALPFNKILPLFQDLEIDDPGYLFHSQTRQNVSAVSIHGLLTPKSLFDEIGGFSRHSADIGISYCKAVTDRQLLVVQEPSAVVRCETFNRTDYSASNVGGGTPDPFFNENFDDDNPRYRLKTR